MTAAAEAGLEPKPRAGWGLKVAAVLIVVLVTLALLAVVGEVGLRWREKNRSTIPGTIPFMFYRHDRLRHALVRNHGYYGWLHVNQQGFRGTVPTPLDPGGQTRIMTVGASTTFDSFVSGDEHAWPARLEHWLRALGPDSTVVVVNAGVPGYRVVDDLIRLQTELYAYRPDLVLFYEGHNDLFAALRPRFGGNDTDPTPNEVAPMAGWEYWLSRHSMLYTKVLARFRAKRWVTSGAASASRQPLSAAAWDSILASGTRQFERDVLSFLSVARALEIPVVVMRNIHISDAAAGTEPDSAVALRWRYTVPSATPELVLRGYREFNGALSAVAARLGVPVIQAEDFRINGARFYAPDDPIHFNDAGADSLGHALATSLIALQLPRHRP